MTNPIGTSSGKSATAPWNAEATKVSMSTGAFRVIDKATPYAAGTAVVASGILLQGVSYGVSSGAKIVVAATAPATLPIVSPVIDFGVGVSAVIVTRVAVPLIETCVEKSVPYVKAAVRESIKAGVAAVACSKSCC